MNVKNVLSKKQVDDLWSSEKIGQKLGYNDYDGLPMHNIKSLEEYDPDFLEIAIELYRFVIAQFYPKILKTPIEERIVRYYIHQYILNKYLGAVTQYEKNQDKVASYVHLFKQWGLFKPVDTQKVVEHIMANENEQENERT